MSDIVAQKWAVYESNVQQYRVISATVQSFLLAVGSIWFSAVKPPPSYLLAMILFLGIAHILVVWVPVVHARIRIVDYYKGQLTLSEAVRAEIAAKCTEKEYEANPSLRDEIAKLYFDKDLQSPVRDTRFKFDVLVPIGYALIWLLMAVYKFA